MGSLIHGRQLGNIFDEMMRHHIEEQVNDRADENRLSIDPI